MRIQKLVSPESLDEACELIKGKNKILGGGTFLAMTDVLIPTAIDLSKLGLDYIKEEPDGIRIGAYTSLHTLETSEVIEKYYGSAIKEAVKNIVGVQFRNSVTAGAAIYKRFGFSDLLTAFLAAGAELVLHRAGHISIDEFVTDPIKNDILTEIILPLNIVSAASYSMRNSYADYAILNLTYIRTESAHRIAVGARPMRATLARDTMAYLDGGGCNLKEAAEMCSEELVFGSNMRASGEYRRQICKVLTERALVKGGI